MAVHRELISAGKFDEKFKRALMDYYSYGYKPSSSYDNWRRLNNILSDYLEWSEERGAVRFASADSAVMEENPFHRVYRFCKYKPIVYPALFLHVLALLSPKLTLRALPQTVQEDEERAMHLEDVLAQGGPFKTSDLLALTGGEVARTLNNRLDDLAALGLVRCVQRRGDRGRPGNLCGEAQRSPGRGNRYWQRGPLVLADLLAAGTAADAEFSRHFRDFLQFYAQALPFGVLGTYLLDRLGGEAGGAFRFKHAYFMQALNDFTALDLLGAMERRQWCRITYRHGTAALETALLCWPLALRYSSMQGRCYLLFYEPVRRSCASLRLEFIDEVFFYDDAAVRAALDLEEATLDADIARAQALQPYLWGSSTGAQQEGNATGEQLAQCATRERLAQRATGEQLAQRATQEKRAQRATQEQPAALAEVRLCIAYDPATEPFIARRLLRECRGGTVSIDASSGTATMCVTVCDAKEMRPWLRSFYGRIISCEGLDFSLAEDVAAMAGMRAPAAASANASAPWDIPMALAEQLGPGTRARDHEALFNEVFSVYYQIIAEVFTRLSAEEDTVQWTAAELQQHIKDALADHYLKIGAQTEWALPDELVQTLLQGGLVEQCSVTRPAPKRGIFKGAPQTVPAVRARYRCAQALDFYRDVVPLSTLELRWLSAALTDRRCDGFLSAAETQAMKALIAEKVPQCTALALERIVYFDRFHFPAEQVAQERAVLPQVLRAIAGAHPLTLCYWTRFGNRRSGRYLPLHLVYSLRDDRIQGIFHALGDGQVVTLNLSHIEQIRVEAETVCHAAVERALASQRVLEERQVTVCFKDVRNLLDRILTEFSPWQKHCRYDAANDRYQLTIRYQLHEEWDITVRLMSYGAGICFENPSHVIARTVAERVCAQAKIFAN